MSQRRKGDNLFEFRPTTLHDWLIVLAGAGIVLLNPVAGARIITSELKEFLKQKIKIKEVEKQIEGKNLSRAIYLLKKRKLIKIEKKGGETSITLTEKGRKRKLKYDIRNLAIKKPSDWDGKWRLLMFDIPELKKETRDVLRFKLKQLKFIQFQKSAWINPYPCEEEIDFLTEAFGVGEYVTFLTIQIENDKPLRKEFNL